MTTSEKPASPDGDGQRSGTARGADLCPRGFARAVHAKDIYLCDPATLKLVQFFLAKGLATLKQEDRLEKWYADWLDYQAQHRIYASVLSPRQYSTIGGEFDLLRYARFLEVFGYFSPAHGYSAQVTFLGLFCILMGASEPLKREAVATLEAGGLLAFGVSEKHHGSDLLANEFKLAPLRDGRYVANGSKYYIGNCNVASMIPILARVEARPGDRGRRVPLVLFALRPPKSPGFGNVRKISTLGVRSGYVGEFEVTHHELPATDLIADGRQAWDAVLGTVTLGKFFLGFGSIGICEHALEEAADHLKTRILYGRPAIEMPHLRAAMAQAYARLTAMKLFAYRALEDVHAAHAHDRRYLLYCAVQKAKVSTEGVKVIALLSECIGAKGFEADTFFEMALRDALLIPSLESSAHINLALTAQFCTNYFGGFDRSLAEPAPLGDAAGSRENAYLMEARGGNISTITFPPVLRAYRALKAIANIRIFIGQLRCFRRFVRSSAAMRDLTDKAYALALGQCVATIAYAQLIAENAGRAEISREYTSAVFHGLVMDLGAAALALACQVEPDTPGRLILQQMATAPQTSQADWDYVSSAL